MRSKLSVRSVVFVCLVGFSLAVGFTAVPGLAAEPPTAEALLARAIDYHDPAGSLLGGAHRLRFSETRPNGPDRRTEILIDVPGERFEVVRQGDRRIAGTVAPGQCQMTLDGRTDLTDEEREQHRLSCDRLQTMRDYYTYLWALPMKLRDPGTRLGEVTATTFQKRAVWGLRVTYDEAVGGDIWYFYFDPDTAALVGYRFYHDEAKNDGEVIYLEGEVVADGLRIPKSRTWYTHQDDRLLGTDTLLEIVAER